MLASKSAPKQEEILKYIESRNTHTHTQREMRKTLGSVLKFMCTRVLPILVVLVAVFVGWLRQKPIPEGTFFATIFPLMKGIPPATIFGSYSVPLTPEVPADMLPLPRPTNEKFYNLPEGYQMPASGLGMCCRPSAYDDETVYRTVLWYLLLGGRHIDGADLYLNHKAIGRGIKEAMKRGVKRSEIFLTTKIPTRSLALICRKNRFRDT